jgi:pyruvate formate lyase activating enzyme
MHCTAWGAPAAVHVDPIEKKPLHHFLPGTSTFSIGTVGCNLGCSFCQNWELARAREDPDERVGLDPAAIVRLAVRHGCPSISFTYNEPTIAAEYVADVSEAAHAVGLRTVLVTNGYVTAEGFHALWDGIDAANVDLKSLSDGFYRKVTLGRLAPVLETLERARAETGVWLEVTHLVIPGLNDSPAETEALAIWLHEHLGPDVPLHLTAFHPDHRLRDVPPTPVATLARARAIARRVGLRHVYAGNVPGAGADTVCPVCDATLIQRDGFDVLADGLRAGRCGDCGEALPGCWESGTTIVGQALGRMVAAAGREAAAGGAAGV